MKWHFSELKALEARSASVIAAKDQVSVGVSGHRAVDSDL